MYKRRLFLMLGAVGTLTAILAVGFVLHIRHIIANSPKPKPQVVSTTIAALARWQPQLSSIGNLRAQLGVDISPEIAGIVSTVNINSGDQVDKGQLLVQLNAEADVAQWNALKASADLAQLKLKRDRGQLAVQGVSQAVIDADIADLKSKSALAEQQGALVAKKSIKAPFTGKLGITHINPGQYLTQGQVIVSLQTTNPMLVDFSLPQQNLASLKVGQTVHVSSDTFPNRIFDGHITAINANVDVETRNIQIEATINNPSGELLTGMFATVKVDDGDERDVLSVPQTAITFHPYGATVFYVKHLEGKLTAEQTFVETGEARGDMIEIKKGISVGQQIITSGQIKLKNGTEIEINNQVVPSEDLTPTPQEQ